jgi:predicted nuclease with RNAse H fold
MRTLGVDLASAITNTAACVLEWDDGPPRLGLLVGRNVSDDDIVAMAREVETTAIDAPFGWPQPFAKAIAAYRGGRPWPRRRPEGLWLRQTDEHAMAVAGGRPPLSVSSDRIARPAERAARLLTLLGVGGRAAGRDGSDDVIEVYPAGALRCWGIATAGYKRPDGVAARTQIVEAITSDLDFVLIDEERNALVATDHAVDALVASLVARAFALGRVHRPADGELTLARVEGWLYLPIGGLGDLA